MKRSENCATSFRFLLPFKNSCQEISRFSREMILLKLTWHGFRTLSLSLDNRTTILNKIKEGYLTWMGIVPHIPKTARFTIGFRIENKFLDLLEISYTSYFSEKEKKTERLSECIFTLDILKFLISTAWEGKFISHKQYEEMAVKLDEIGKMLWGWRKSLNKSQTKTPLKAGKR